MNGAVIARTSQPEVGWLFWRSREDEMMIQQIVDACNRIPIDSASRKIIIERYSCFSQFVCFY